LWAPNWFVNLEGGTFIILNAYVCMFISLYYYKYIDCGVHKKLKKHYYKRSYKIVHKFPGSIEKLSLF